MVIVMIAWLFKVTLIIKLYTYDGEFYSMKLYFNKAV